MLIIIVLVFRQPEVSQRFGKEDNGDTADETKNSIKDGDFLPPEMGVPVRKDKTEKTHSCNADIQGQA